MRPVEVRLHASLLPSVRRAAAGVSCQPPRRTLLPMRQTAYSPGGLRAQRVKLDHRVLGIAATTRKMTLAAWLAARERQ